MRFTRREIVLTGAAAGALGALAGCEKVITGITRRVQPPAFHPPDAAAPSEAIDADYHLLSRAAHGPSPADLAEVRSLGRDAWLDRQLRPESIDDTLCDLRARRFETLQLSPGTCFEFKKPVLREEITRHTLLRAVYSKRQLFEVMVGFWTDHFNISIDKGDCVYYKPSDDRLVIRAHALGGRGAFRAMLRASATSPAMLVYLDGKDNVKRGNEAPNENYARELMELHTMGVDGGYTQRDVYEAARCLTGWRLHEKWRRGVVHFDPSLHDDGEKAVLGHIIPAGGGAGDLDKLIDIVCDHPATPRFLARKLVRRFVADDPPASLVDRVAAVWREGDGDIAAAVRAILTSHEFAASAGEKVKPPFKFVASALRAVDADTHAHAPLIETLSSMGQGLFQHPAPDGYPDTTPAWAGTLLWRWNFAFALASGELRAVTLPIEAIRAAIGTGDRTPARLFAMLVGRRPSEAEEAVLNDIATPTPRGTSNDAGSGDEVSRVIGLVLASPAFQRC